MVHHYIPFMYAQSDWSLISSLYRDPAGYRVPLQAVLSNSFRFPSNTKIWIDCGADGLHFSRVTDPSNETNPAYKSYISKFAGFNRIADPHFQRKPDKSKVVAFVNELLNKAANTVPSCNWLSVP